jgi:hypothetical protein
MRVQFYDIRKKSASLRSKKDTDATVGLREKGRSHPPQEGSARQTVSSKETLVSRAVHHCTLYTTGEDLIL